MKSILTTSDETGCKLKDIEVNWPDKPPTIMDYMTEDELTDWKAKYEELKESLLQSLDERIKSLEDEYIESKSDYNYGCLDEARYIRQSIIESFEENK